MPKGITREDAIQLACELFEDAYSTKSVQEELVQRGTTRSRACAWAKTARRRLGIYHAGSAPRKRGALALAAAALRRLRRVTAWRRGAAGKPAPKKHSTADIMSALML